MTPPRKILLRCPSGKLVGSATYEFLGWFNGSKHAQQPGTLGGPPHAISKLLIPNQQFAGGQNRAATGRFPAAAG